MDTNESRNHSQEEMNLDALSGIMDQFIHDAHIGMMINIPAESDEVIIEDNLGCGAVGQFYIILNAMGTAIKNLAKDMTKIAGREPDNMEGMIDAMLGLMRQELMESLSENE